MKKISVALFNAFIKIFRNKSTDCFITMVCIAQNGFNGVCCANFLIKNITALSD